ncbi:hypothetical protein GCM10010121_024510 [Streptomyces brasiliensis]|uniref:Uncharacterized protein n=1 Tax=Streptomyces brasiliensis TaxID=1954 RepID=A0A917NN30_9ACTN|nr:hypothetical protein GCM10010121_024510 [Streptomyces brasiliensis]
MEAARGVEDRPGRGRRVRGGEDALLGARPVVQGTTIKVPYDKQVPGLPVQSGAGGGYMSPPLVSQAWRHHGTSRKGLMTWSVNRDGSKNWTFGDNVKALQGS